MLNWRVSPARCWPQPSPVPSHGCQTGLNQSSVRSACRPRSVTRPLRCSRSPGPTLTGLVPHLAGAGGDVVGALGRVVDLLQEADADGEGVGDASSGTRRPTRASRRGTWCPARPVRPRRAGRSGRGRDGSRVPFREVVHVGRVAGAGRLGLPAAARERRARPPRSTVAICSGRSALSSVPNQALSRPRHVVRDEQRLGARVLGGLRELGRASSAVAACGRGRPCRVRPCRRTRRAPVPTSTSGSLLRPSVSVPPGWTTASADALHLERAASRGATRSGTRSCPSVTLRVGAAKMLSYLIGTWTAPDIGRRRPPCGRTP